MSYSAKQLFTDWYNRATRKEATSEELQNRRDGIEHFIASSETKFWLKTVKAYLGLLSADASEFKELVLIFKEKDALFAVTNVNLLRFLCGCAIAEKIEEGEEFISDFLALAVLCDQEESTSDILPELRQIAFKAWIAECERFRSIVFPEVPQEIKMTTAKIAAPPIAMDAGVDANILKAYGDKLVISMNALHKEITASVERINEIISNQDDVESSFKALSEESDVLWWLFSGQSELLNKRFSEVTPELLAIAASFELERLTKVLPGVGKIDKIIEKLIADNTSSSEIPSVVTGNIIDSVLPVAATLNTNLPQAPEEVKELTPLFASIRYAVQTGAEWKKSTSIKLNLDKAVLLTEFSSQLYKELMLSRMYKVCTENE